MARASDTDAAADFPLRHSLKNPTMMSAATADSTGQSEAIIVGAPAMVKAACKSCTPRLACCCSNSGRVARREYDQSGAKRQARNLRCRQDAVVEGHRRRARREHQSGFRKPVQILAEDTMRGEMNDVVIPQRLVSEFCLGCLVPQQNVPLGRDERRRNRLQFADRLRQFLHLENIRALFYTRARRERRCQLRQVLLVQHRIADAEKVERRPLAPRMRGKGQVVPSRHDKRETEISDEPVRALQIMTRSQVRRSIAEKGRDRHSGQLAGKRDDRMNPGPQACFQAGEQNPLEINRELDGKL